MPHLIFSPNERRMIVLESCCASILLNPSHPASPLAQGPPSPGLEESVVVALRNTSAAGRTLTGPLHGAPKQSRLQEEALNRWKKGLKGAFHVLEGEDTDSVSAALDGRRAGRQ